jgi:hypothetical protein
MTDKGLFINVNKLRLLVNNLIYDCDETLPPGLAPSK